MKKLYRKPVIQMEKFNMDIEIMAGVDSKQWNDWKQLYRLTHGGQEPSSNAEFTAWLASDVVGYDNSTSGYCFFTAIEPS